MRTPAPEPLRLTPVPVSRAPKTWLLLGPFDNPGGQGMGVVYGPEARIDLPAAAAGKAGKIFWKTATASITETGSARLDLAREFNPKDHVIAYAVIHVRARAGTPARLLVGSDDGVKVWVDGEEVHCADRSRVLKVDEDSIPCRLVAGWNLLLFKVAQGTGDFELAVRITGPDGQPIEGLDYDPFGDLPGRPGSR